MRSFEQLGKLKLACECGLSAASPRGAFHLAYPEICAAWQPINRLERQRKGFIVNISAPE